MNLNEIHSANKVFGGFVDNRHGASGRKLRVMHHIAKPNVTRVFGVRPGGSTQDEVLFAGQTDYLLGGSLVVKDGSIDKVLFDGGYAKATRLGSTTYGFSPYYYNKDHLGNIREVVNTGGKVQQVTNYYPFGAPYADPNAVMGATVQPYKYNGKELDRMHGLDTYDYGARQYDPILARWDRVDPLCEKYYAISPYAYCGNNPMRYIDPDGRKIVLANNCSPEFVKQYNAAYAYLKEHNAAQVWEKLNERKEIITIYEHTEKANYTLKDNIYWNPFSGVYTSAKGEGHRLSPTIRLIHEMGHKLQELTGEYDTASDGSV